MGGIKEEVCNALILPRRSRDFLNGMGSVLDVNLYLSQNRFCYKIRSDSKKYASLLGEGIYKNEIQSDNIYETEAQLFIEHLNCRSRRAAEHFRCHRFYEFQIHDKLILGEGGGVYHNIQPLRLHPLYGIPYIPASVIKGTLRSVWVIERYGGDEEKAKEDDGFLQLFEGKGAADQPSEGKLIFFDIYPKEFTIGLDVQTVHYKRYYDSNQSKGRLKQPTDDQSPVPVLFVCLRKGVFPVFIANHDENVWDHRKEEIDEMIELMFTQYGIGAKTALGYGTGKVSWEESSTYFDANPKCT